MPPLQMRTAICCMPTGTRRFGWFDGTSPESSGYSGWGTYVEGRVATEEPNNKPSPQDCGVANLTQAIAGLYGWADADCAMQYPFVCEISRRWPAALAGRLLETCNASCVRAGPPAAAARSSQPCGDVCRRHASPVPSCAW
jgi:hypothetical protein